MRRTVGLFGYRDKLPHLLLRRHESGFRLLDEPDVPATTLRFQRDDEYAAADRAVLWACATGELPPAPPACAWRAWDDLAFEVASSTVAKAVFADDTEAVTSLLRKVARLDGRQWVCAIVGCKDTSTRFTPAVSADAFRAGQIAAELGFAVLTGGLGGVMSRAAEGASGVSGMTIGILPGGRHEDANPHIRFVLPSGIGYARNILTAVASDVLVALPGGTGTLEEICFALDFNRPVLSWGSWEIEQTIRVPAGDDAALRSELVRVMNRKFTGE